MFVINSPKAVSMKSDRWKSCLCTGFVLSAAIFASVDAAERKPRTPKTGSKPLAEADEDPVRSVPEDQRPEPLAMKTFGGRQFWGDVHFFHDWRIQKNVFTGHHRLLDGSDNRHTWGTLDECRAKLEEIQKKRKLPEMSGKAVVMIHGIVRSSKSFSTMRGALENAGYKVFGFDYPSTQVKIPESAEYLHQCLESMKGIDEINFVVHSMGGLVVRSYLASHEDERIQRMVMLGVPNKGAEMADFFQRNLLFKAIYGPAGQQLVTNPKGLIATLPIPDFEFAVIAGARGDERGFNPLIDGDDDGTVRLVSTRLEGAADFCTVQCLHSLMMRDPSVIDQSVRFLKVGRLRAQGPRQPIPLKAQAAAQANAPAR